MLLQGSKRQYCSMIMIKFLNHLHCKSEYNVRVSQKWLSDCVGYSCGLPVPTIYNKFHFSISSNFSVRFQPSSISLTLLFYLFLLVSLSKMFRYPQNLLLQYYQ